MLAVGEQLAAAFRSTGLYEHRLTTGEARETELSDALRPFIPTVFDMAAGEVTNVAGARSEQQDVLIFNAVQGAPFVRHRERTILPVELLYASLQVKSRITASTVPDAVNNLASMKALMSSGWRFPPGSTINVAEGTNAKPWGAVVAFEGPADLDDLVIAFSEANRALPDSADRCDALLVIDSAVIFDAHAEPSKPPVIHTSAPRNAVVRVDAGTDALLAFYMALSTRLANYRPPPYQIAEYESAVGAFDHTTMVLREPTGAPDPDVS